MTLTALEWYADVCQICLELHQLKKHRVIAWAQLSHRNKPHLVIFSITLSVTNLTKLSICMCVCVRVCVCVCVCNLMCYSKTTVTYTVQSCTNSTELVPPIQDALRPGATDELFVCLSVCFHATKHVYIDTWGRYISSTSTKFSDAWQIHWNTQPNGTCLRKFSWKCFVTEAVRLAGYYTCDPFNQKRA